MVLVQRGLLLLVVLQTATENNCLQALFCFRLEKNKEKDCCSLGWEAIYMAAFISLSRRLESGFCWIFTGEMRRF
ncbi:hypothetical protein POPTR_013G159101v4 [Populus trichocarpa]|uniref:Uncharacterized protein n=1 Tax=Populus trichocarpa TaxID=3694 RepID=A0ACC0S3B4_POPTR|nr:hypothetical protein BDE02_13G136900 [Populus trichocarpa]KAI9383919.1 hypothetical protein POPTR_013G159101v4 [Populus trichocarpa]